ncbi:MAG: hypothetical protein EAZ36_05650 [Verrucomicrobia bacterium]|nr:MAG: hypothetical protein EAZ36_05650 [Verrucomicrobiota bacterium]
MRSAKSKEVGGRGAVAGAVFAGEVEEVLVGGDRGEEVVGAGEGFEVEELGFDGGVAAFDGGVCVGVGVGVGGGLKRWVALRPVMVPWRPSLR